MKRSLGVLVVACSFHSAWAGPVDNIFVPLTVRSLVEAPSHSNLFGESGLNVQGSLPSGGGLGGGIRVSGSAPFDRSGVQRHAGWGFAVSAFLVEQHLREARLYSPPSYGWELTLKRGNVSSAMDAATGIRGYFEVGLLNERPRLGRQTDIQLDLAGRAVPDQNFALTLRTGVMRDRYSTGDSAELGYVVQGQPFLFWSFEAATTVALSSPQVGAWSLTSQFGRACVSWMRCSLLLRFLQTRNPQETAGTKDLKRSYTAGPVLRFVLSGRTRLESRLLWSSFDAGSAWNTPPVPQLHLSILRIF